MEFNVMKKYVLDDDRKATLRFLDQFLTQDQINQLSADSLKEFLGTNGDINKLSFYDSFRFQDIFREKAQKIIQEMIDKNDSYSAYIEVELTQNFYVTDTSLWKMQPEQIVKKDEFNVDELPF